MIRFIEDYMLKKYDVISFDIFDTLIERTCSVPADIFELTEDGRLAAVEWIRQQYESRLDYWEAAPAVPDTISLRFATHPETIFI